MLTGKSYYFVVLSIAGLLSCATASNRKSAKYYKENQHAISDMLSLYEKLYRQQAFSAGFTDKSCEYYVLEVVTDTVRYIYDNEKNKVQFYETIMRFHYDTVLLKELAAKMKAVKCLWLSKSSFYSDEVQQTVTFLSFKSAGTDRPFVENKYYILIFLKHPLASSDVYTRVKKGDLVKINELVYFMIGTKFR